MGKIRFLSVLVGLAVSLGELYGAFPQNHASFDSPIKIAYDFSSLNDDSIEAVVVAENESLHVAEIALVDSSEGDPLPSRILEKKNPL